MVWGHILMVALFDQMYNPVAWPVGVQNISDGGHVSKQIRNSFENITTIGNVTFSTSDNGTLGRNATMYGYHNSTANPPEITHLFNLEEYMLENYNLPKRGGLTQTIIITIVYGIIFITGLTGNLATCVVIAKNKFMHTATNYYLFNLAVSDILVLVLGLPTETYEFWSAYPFIFGEPFCLIRAHASETATYASILTITAFTVERYIAICHPMKAQTVSSLSRAVKVVVMIWVVCALCAIPMTVQFGIEYTNNTDTGDIIPESARCVILNLKTWAFEISVFLFFVTPMTMITVLYALIAVAVRRSTLSRAGSDSSSSSDQGGTQMRAQQQAKARSAVLKMLMAVVVAFFICWAPFHAQRLMGIYIPQADNNGFTTAMWYISGVLYYVSSLINPILYNIMSLKFRQAFKNTILRDCLGSCWKKKAKRIKKSTYKTYKFQKRSKDTNYCSSDEYQKCPRDNEFKLDRNRNPKPNVPLIVRCAKSSGAPPGSGTMKIIKLGDQNGLEIKYLFEDYNCSYTKDNKTNGCVPAAVGTDNHNGYLREAPTARSV